MSWIASATLSYNAAGGSPTPNAQRQSVTVDDSQSSVSIRFTISSTRPKRSGYTFKSWGNRSPGGGYYVTVTRGVPHVNATLTAVWERIYYNIKFDANGGSGAPPRGTKEYGEAYTIPMTVPTWEGHTFRGWNTVSTGTGTWYAPGGTYTANKALTLYAVWDEAARYKAKVLAGGEWKTVKGMKVLVGGEWKTVTSIKTLIGGEWK